MVALPVLDDGPEHRRVRVSQAGAGLRALAERFGRVGEVSEPWGGGVEALDDGSLDQFAQDGVLGVEVEVEVEAPPQDTDVATPSARFWSSAGDSAARLGYRPATAGPRLRVGSRRAR
jgi:hypothetical protein